MRILYYRQTFNSLVTGASPKPIKVKASYNAYLDSKADEIYKEIARRMKAGIESESATTTTTTTSVSSSEGMSETQKAEVMTQSHICTCLSRTKLVQTKSGMNKQKIFPPKLTWQA